MRLPGLVCGFVLVWIFYAAAAQSASDSLFTLLRSIPTPQELVYPHFPGSYRVTVTMSGPIAREMQTMLTGFNVTEAHFEEVFEDRQSRLEVSNPDYSYETRELICGILNPIAMTDVVLASFLRYRNEKELRAIIKETQQVRSRLAASAQTLFRVSLTPRGDRFAYRYEDQGAQIVESWLTRLEVVVDSASRTVSTITLLRQSRLIEASLTASPAVQTEEYTYSIEYTAVEGVRVPVSLSMTRNHQPVLTMRAAYRHENNKLVFDTRSICMTSPTGEAQCLDLAYGSYQFSARSAVSNRPIKNDAMARQMKAAAKLLREVQDNLSSGNIERALRLLNRCVQDYGQTPQALEARRLLQGLPGR